MPALSPLDKLRAELTSLADPEKAKVLQRFFKTGQGEYGEGDRFLGIVVPVQRKVAKKYGDLPLTDIGKLLLDRQHEHRLVALLILVARFGKSPVKEQREIASFYLTHTRRINNWDLVDLSAPQILGSYLLDRDRTILYRLAKSKDLWERRIAIMATLAFIRQRQFDDTLAIAQILLGDEHDLIHKAVGWMLREIGKQDQRVEEVFLEEHAARMPRTMLRYAIERFDAAKRAYWMKRKRSSREG